MKHLKTIVFLLLLASTSILTQGQSFRGIILNSDDQPIPDVSIYVENSTYGVISNAKGEFVLQLKTDSHYLTFTHLSYQAARIGIKAPQKEQQRFYLSELVTDLQQVTIAAEYIDPSNEVMKNASKARHKNGTDSLAKSYQVYIKASLEKEQLEAVEDSSKQDSIKVKTKKQLNLIEKIAVLHEDGKGKKKEIVTAFKNYSDKAKLIDISSNLAYQGYFIEESHAYDIVGDDDINPLLFYLYPQETDFNFYKAQLQLDRLHENRFTSPLHPLARASYRFRLSKSFMEGDQLIYQIEVMPKRPSDALFNGHIFIVDKEWAIKAVDFWLSPRVLSDYRKFRVIQNFAKGEGGQWRLEREEFFYEAKEEARTFIGHTEAIYSDYATGVRFSDKFFNQELSQLSKETLDSTDARLIKMRPIVLQAEELLFIKNQDSLREAELRIPALLKKDSSFNHTDFLDIFLFGIEHQNSIKGNYLYIIPVLDQLRFFQPGGYRHALGGTYSKFYPESGKKWATYTQIDYGFLNQDLRGHQRLEYSFNPFNFSTLSAGFGSEYELMNTNTTFLANITPGNYNLVNHLTVGYDQEYSNGLFINSSLRYARHLPIADMEMPAWIDTLVKSLEEYYPDTSFGGFSPEQFSPYSKLLLDIDIAIRFKQKYRMTPERKVLLGSKYPKIQANIQLGIPKILGSTSAFLFTEVGIQDRMQLGAFGYSQYNMEIGSFLWSDKIQLVDEKYFIGGDIVWMSNPMKAFQLLGQSAHSQKPYASYHFRHQFDGSLMNKIPLLRSLRLGVILGSNALWLREGHYRHIEAYGGIEKKFRLGKELFKFSVLWIGGSGNFTTTKEGFRLGLSVFNPMSRSWM